jgi:hypothetical protein
MTKLLALVFALALEAPAWAQPTQLIPSTTTSIALPTTTHHGAPSGRWSEFGRDLVRRDHCHQPGSGIGRGDGGADRPRSMSHCGDRRGFGVADVLGAIAKG